MLCKSAHSRCDGLIIVATVITLSQTMIIDVTVAITVAIIVVIVATVVIMVAMTVYQVP